MSQRKDTSPSDMCAAGLIMCLHTIMAALRNAS